MSRACSRVWSRSCRRLSSTATRKAATFGDGERREDGMAASFHLVRVGYQVPVTVARGNLTRDGLWCKAEHPQPRGSLESVPKRPRPARLAALRGLRSTHDAAREQA